MSVKKDYKEEKVIITGGSESVYPYPLYCKVRSADSEHHGELRLSKGAIEKVHIDRKAATELLPVLQRYVDTGKVVEPEYRVVRGIGGFIVCDSENELACEVCFVNPLEADKVCNAFNRINKAKGEDK